MFLVVVNVDVCFVLLFLFRLLNPGHVEDPMPEAEVKWNMVGWKGCWDKTPPCSLTGTALSWPIS